MGSTTSQLPKNPKKSKKQSVTSQKTRFFEEFGSWCSFGCDLPGYPRYNHQPAGLFNRAVGCISHVMYHGKSLINGGFNGKIIYFYGPFSMDMLNNQRVNPMKSPLCMVFFGVCPCTSHETTEFPHQSRPLP